MLFFGWALKSDAYLGLVFWQKWTGNPSWSFLFWLCQKCLRSSFLCSVSVLLILLPFTILGSTKQNLHSGVLDLWKIFYLIGLAVAENTNNFKVVLHSWRQEHKWFLFSSCLPFFAVPKVEFYSVISDTAHKFTRTHLAVSIGCCAQNWFVFLILSLFLCANTVSDDARR